MKVGVAVGGLLLVLLALYTLENQRSHKQAVSSFASNTKVISLVLIYLRRLQSRNDCLNLPYSNVHKNQRRYAPPPPNTAQSGETISELCSSTGLTARRMIGFRLYAPEGVMQLEHRVSRSTTHTS